jgi:hypothetical protein
VGGYDFWIVRLNSTGEKLWERTFGHEDLDVALGVIQTVDGGFVVVGSSLLLSGAWVVRLDSSGNLIWEHAFSSVGFGISVSDIQCTSDGGVIAAGSIWSDSQQQDAMVMKLAPDALTAPQLKLVRPSSPNSGTPKHVTLRGIAGRTYVTEQTEDFLSWLPFATNTLSSNSVELLDQTPAPAKRFYRAMMLP